MTQLVLDAVWSGFIEYLGTITICCVVDGAHVLTSVT